MRRLKFFPPFTSGEIAGKVTLTLFPLSPAALRKLEISFMVTAEKELRRGLL